VKRGELVGERGGRGAAAGVEARASLLDEGVVVDERRRFDPPGACFVVLAVQGSEVAREEQEIGARGSIASAVLRAGDGLRERAVSERGLAEDRVELRLRDLRADVRGVDRLRGGKLARGALASARAAQSPKRLNAPRSRTVDTPLVANMTHANAMYAAKGQSRRVPKNPPMVPRIR